MSRLKARGYAKTINPRLNDYLAGSPPGRVAIIAMDYFEKPRELVPNVIKMNSTAGATAGHDVGASAMVDISASDHCPPSAGSRRRNRSAGNQPTDSPADHNS